MQRIKISRIGSVIIILFAAFGTIVLSFILQPNSIREVYEAVIYTKSNKTTWFCSNYRNYDVPDAFCILTVPGTF